METEIQGSSYNIKTAVFEGPFGLLLNLVEKRKLFINDLSLAQVTEDYLAYLNRLDGPASTHGDSSTRGGLPAEEISSFVLVASTLILIKSKSLLPNLELTDEEEGDIKNLEERLRLYEIFSKLSGNIKNNFGAQIIWPAEERRNRPLVFLPDEKITRESMMTFAQNVLSSMPKKTFMPEVEVKKVISIEEMIDNLTERIKNSLKMSFRDLHGHNGKVRTKEEKVLVIVGFLAMLELVRQGMIDALQDDPKGDILIEKMSEANTNPAEYEQ